MAYEYNPESSRFNLPNPHRVENVMLAATAAVMLGLGVYGLFMVRDALRAEDLSGVVPGLLVSFFLLWYGAWAALKVGRQLTFYFGRNQPDGLRPDQDLKETIRQNAILFPVPVLATDQLLYRLVPKLVFSPQKVQLRARQQFAHTLVVLVLGLCYLLATIGGVVGAITDWVNWIAFGLLVMVIVLPLTERGRQITYGPKHFIVLLAVSILGPTIATVGDFQVPDFPLDASIAGVNVFILMAGLAINGLFIAALLNLTLQPEKISSINSMQRLSMNAHPRQLVVEFDRLMQDSWTERIPNRIFERVEPTIAGDQGRFRASILEESQPVPRDSGALSFADALSLREYRFLTIIDLAAMIMGASGAVWLITLLGGGISPQQITSALIPGLMVVLSVYGFLAANPLWRRFEFTSRAYWLEIDGNFQASNIDYGRALDDAVRTQKRVINIEDMTMRVWVVDLYSVCFDINEPRDLISMAANGEDAELIGRRLSDFANEQRVFVAPTSTRDRQSLETMASMNAATADARTALEREREKRAVAAGVASVQGPADTAASQRTGHDHAGPHNGNDVVPGGDAT